MSWLRGSSLSSKEDYVLHLPMANDLDKHSTEHEVQSDSSSAEVTSDSSSEEENENIPDDCGVIDNSTSIMYSLAFDPYRLDLSDHDSDQELCKEQDCDTDEEDDDVENRLCAPVSVHSKDWCICGKCETLPEGEVSYCCSDVGVVRDMMETENQCITEHSKFCNFILNRDALEMATYGHKTISYPDKDDQDSFHQLLRHAAYRSFLNLLEFHGLGKNNRYRLPACVIQSIRSKYPSISNEYVGFKESEFSSQSNGT